MAGKGKTESSSTSKAGKDIEKKKTAPSSAKGDDSETVRKGGIRKQQKRAETYSVYIYRVLK